MFWVQPWSEKLLHVSLSSSGRIFQLTGVTVPSAVIGELFFLCGAGWFILELHSSPRQMHHVLSSSTTSKTGPVSALSLDLIVNGPSMPHGGDKESQWASHQKTWFLAPVRARPCTTQPLHALGTPFYQKLVTPTISHRLLGIKTKANVKLCRGEGENYWSTTKQNLMLVRWMGFHHL